MIMATLVPQHSIRYFIFFAILIAFSIPAFTEAATAPEAKINELSFGTTNFKPIITGNATGTKTLRIVMHKDESSTIFASKTVKVSKGKWKMKQAKKLPKGIYTVDIFTTKDRKKAIASGTLTIGQKESGMRAGDKTTLTVTTVPLLFGGTAGGGKSVPVSYLQITNTGKATTTVTGFKVKQNGSALTTSIVGLSTVDDKGGSRAVATGTALFKDNVALAPTNATFAPGQMRLFTIKAIMGANLSAHVGKQLKIDVISVETAGTVKSGFPLRGTTWTLTN